MRTLPWLLLAGCLVAACGGGDDDDDNSAWPDECGPIDDTAAQPNTLLHLINQPSVLKQSCSPYHIVDPTAVTAEMSIEPGVRIVACQGGCRSRLTFGGSGGRLLAQGTADEPIVFSSEYQGPLRGQWTGILFLEAASGSTLQHVVIELAGGPYSAADDDDEFNRYEFPVEGALLDDSTPNLFLDQVEIRQSRGYAVAATTKDGWEQDGNDLYGQILGLTIVDSQLGMWIPVDQGGTLGDDICFGERAEDGTCPAGPGPTDNYVELHLDDRLGRTPENVTRDATWAGFKAPYKVENVNVVDDALLTLADGADLRMTDLGGIAVGVSSPGALQAVAAAPGGIHIGSAFDAPTPQQHWRGISLWDMTDDARTHLENVTIEYGGRVSLSATEAPANLQIFDASPTIVGNLVRESVGTGIHWNCMSEPLGLEAPPANTNTGEGDSIACAAAIGSNGVAENYGCPCPGTPQLCRDRCPN